MKTEKLRMKNVLNNFEKDMNKKKVEEKGMQVGVSDWVAGGFAPFTRPLRWHQLTL